MAWSAPFSAAAATSSARRAVLRQLLDAAPERGLDPGAGAEGGGERLAALELGVGEQRRHLEQRERVAAGARHEPLGDRQRDPRALRALEQRARLRRPQRADLQPLEPGPDRDRPAAVGAEQDDPLGAEPAAGEQQRLERAVVEPLAVVDERQQRLLLGGRGEQAQHARHDGVAIAAGRLAERERPAQRGGLGRRDRVEPVEQRPEQLASGPRTGCPSRSASRARAGPACRRPPPRRARARAARSCRSRPRRRAAARRSGRRGRRPAAGRSGPAPGRGRRASPMQRSQGRVPCDQRVGSRGSAVRIEGREEPGGGGGLRQAERARPSSAPRPPRRGRPA